MSLNLYTYCHNDPINLFDPSGHEYTTLRELVNTSINGSIIPNNKEGYVTVSAYGKTVNVDYDTSKNSYQMSNVNGTLYMDRTEFLKMMGVDAIVMSSGNYNVSKIEAKLRTGAANAPAFMAGAYVTGYSLAGKKLAASFSKGIPGIIGKVLKGASSGASGLFTIELIPSVEVEAGIYVEEHFMVRYGDGNIHSKGVITQHNENGALQSTVSMDSVFKDDLGLPWNQREDALRTSNPSFKVIKIN